VADHNYIVETFDQLTPIERAEAFGIPDFLERETSRRMQRVDDLYETIHVVYDDDRDRPLGRISVFRRRLLAHRDPDTGAAKLLGAGLIEFPVTPLMVPEIWDILFERALATLPTAAVYLLPECRWQVDYLSGLGFKRYADDCDSPRSLYVRHEDSGQRPETGAWTAIENYSGFSGYAWLTPLLDSLLDSPRRLLSLPAGTGDVIRLLPERVLADVHSCVGVDILDRNVEFAEARVGRPYLDLLNMAVCATFLEARVTADPGPALELLHDICAGAGRPLSDEEAGDLYVELRAVADEALTCARHADWFALTEGIGRLAVPSDRPCVSLVDKLGEEGVRSLLAGRPALPSLPALDALDAPDSFTALRDRGGITFETADMYAFRSARPFDTIVVWEALPTVAAAGRQSEYVEMIDANLATGGTVIMAGIGRAADTGHDAGIGHAAGARRVTGRCGRNLEIFAEAFAATGYATALTEASPPSDRWARGYLPQPVFPVLMALKLR
jgi:hypothetical protein